MTHQPIRVLILEDNDADAELVVHQLTEAGYEPSWTRVQDESEFVAALDPALDVILADFSLPTFSAPQALEVLRRRQIGVPMIVVSGSIGEETAVNVLQRGAADYLLKDRLTRLGSAVQRVIYERQLASEKRQIEEALREAEERTRFALNAAGVGVWEVDLRSGSTRWSDTLEALHGMAPGTFGGTLDAFLDCVHPDDRADVVKAIGGRLPQNKTNSNVLYRARWPDGTTRWISATGKTFYDDAGTPLRAAGIGLDVTERHILEQQYHQAQKVETIGQLAGGVAHDFNNLLTAILGYCDLLRDGMPDDARRADLEEIRKAGVSAAALTTRLLAFSRKQLVEPRVIDLNAVLTDMAHMLHRIVGEDVEIDFRLSQSLGRVKADPAQMSQVLMNLVVNARDAMPKGGKVTVETANVVLDEAYASSHLSVVPGPHVMLAVTDTGSGMTPDVQAHLFEPFFTTKEPGKGTGLGLASVQGIVKQSGGNIWVYSELRHGTTFKIYLPRAEEAAVTAVSQASAAVAFSGSETVLVVEDNPSLRTLVAKILQRYGYAVLLAPTAEDALRYCTEQAESIKLLLTDVVMPGVSGPELVSQLGPLNPAMRVLYMSGYTDDAIVRHGFLSGGAAFVQKPFTPETLARKVRQVLDSAHGDYV